MRPASVTYLELIEGLALRPVRTVQDYEGAQRRIVELKGIRDQFSVDESDYLEVLTMLVERYERAETRAYSDE